MFIIRPKPTALPDSSANLPDEGTHYCCEDGKTRTEWFLESMDDTLTEIVSEDDGRTTVRFTLTQDYDSSEDLDHNVYFYLCCTSLLELEVSSVDTQIFVSAEDNSELNELVYANVAGLGTLLTTATEHPGGLPTSPCGLKLSVAIYADSGDWFELTF